MAHWDETQLTTAIALRIYLDRPLSDDPQAVDAGDFDPWEIFGKAVYGSYNSDFDRLAIACLEGVRDRNSASETAAKNDLPELAVEMFYEMLCRAELCEYGTSPKNPWLTAHAEPLWPALIDKWKAYSTLHWGFDVLA